LKAKPVPFWVRWAHGLSALAFLKCLYMASEKSGTAVWIVTGLFTVVFFLGLSLLVGYLRKRSIPLVPTLIHALLGVVAYILLLASLGTK
jgi:hypothetical protein